MLNLTLLLLSLLDYLELSTVKVTDVYVMFLDLGHCWGYATVAFGEGALLSATALLLGARNWLPRRCWAAGMLLFQLEWWAGLWGYRHHQWLLLDYARHPSAILGEGLALDEPLLSAIALLLLLFGLYRVLLPLPGAEGRWLTLLCALQLLLGGSRDFLTFYLLLETANMVLYHLLAGRWALGRRTGRPQLRLETLLGYFLVNLLGSLLLLLGFGFIYFATGSLAFGDISLLLCCSSAGMELVAGQGLALGLLTALCGLLLKLGLAPFHFWVAPIYEALPHFLYVYLMIFPKGGLMLLLLQWGSTLGLSGNHPLLERALLLLAALNLIWGTVGALHQTSLRRLMIYSSLANLSLVFYALATGGVGVSQSGVQYLMLYLFTSASLLLPLGALAESGVLTRWSLPELSRGCHPRLRMLLSLGLLNLSGVPPFSLFFGKVSVALDMVEQGFGLSLGLLLVFSVVAVGYAFQPLLALWYQSQPTEGAPLSQSALPLRADEELAHQLLVSFGSLAMVGLVETPTLGGGATDWELEQLPWSNLSVLELELALQPLLLLLLLLSLWAGEALDPSRAPDAYPVSGKIWKLNRRRGRGLGNDVTPSQSDTSAVADSPTSAADVAEEVAKADDDSPLMAGSDAEVEEFNKTADALFANSNEGGGNGSLTEAELSSDWIPVGNSNVYQKKLPYSLMDSCEELMNAKLTHEIDRDWVNHLLEKYTNPISGENLLVTHLNLQDAYRQWLEKIFSQLPPEERLGLKLLNREEMAPVIVEKVVNVQISPRECYGFAQDFCHGVTNYGWMEKESMFDFVGMNCFQAVHHRCMRGFPKNDSPLSQAQRDFWGISDVKGPSKLLTEHSQTAYKHLADEVWKRLRGPNVELSGADYAEWLEAVASKCNEGLGTQPQYLSWAVFKAGDPVGEHSTDLPLWTPTAERIALGDYASTLQVRRMERFYRITKEGQEEQPSSSEDFPRLRQRLFDLESWYWENCRENPHSKAPEQLTGPQRTILELYNLDISGEAKGSASLVWDWLGGALLEKRVHPDWPFPKIWDSVLVQPWTFNEAKAELPTLLLASALVGLLLGILAAVARLLGRNSGRSSGGDRAASGAYECGFAPFAALSSSSLLLFYRLAVFFVVFEAELIFLFPWAAALPAAAAPGALQPFLAPFGFVLLLFYGYARELRANALKLLLGQLGQAPLPFLGGHPKVRSARSNRRSKCKRSRLSPRLRRYRRYSHFLRKHRSACRNGPLRTGSAGPPKEPSGHPKTPLRLRRWSLR